jgi:hypothetical protein
LSTRDGKKARIDVSKTREEKDDGVVVALDDGEKPKEMQKLLHRTRALGKQMSALSLRLNAFEKVFVDTITTRFEETNGFIFEALTALSAAPRCVHPFLSSQHQRRVEKNEGEEIREGKRASEKISAASDSAFAFRWRRSGALD